jgi:hypothetical protein
MTFLAVSQSVDKAVSLHAAFLLQVLGRLG